MLMVSHVHLNELGLVDTISSKSRKLIQRVIYDNVLQATPPSPFPHIIPTIRPYNPWVNFKKKLLISRNRRSYTRKADLLLSSCCNQRGQKKWPYINLKEKTFNKRTPERPILKIRSSEPIIRNQG
jgi:hypothetical protein